MNRQKMMALVAHDNMNHDLAEWVDWNCEKLSKPRIVCTGTTGKIVEETLLHHSASHHYEQPALDLKRLKARP
ncbi:methylglyoxal synthase, partial [Alistipes putredinis]|nr:methylglyoxal synthase [Alistipes putredinis]